MSVFVAFIAGFVTVLSPCVLPLLPVIMASAVQEGRLRPWGVLAGFVLSFSLITLLLATLVNELGLQPDVVRTVSAVVLLLAGTTLAVPRLSHVFEIRMGGVAAISTRLPSGDGLLGGLALGSGLGLAWTPCVGPIMASVITLAMNQTITGGAIGVTLAYSLGTAVPMAAVIFGGRTLVRRLTFLQRNSGVIRGLFGGLLVLVGVMILTGADRTIQTWLLKAFPNWETALTSWEPQPAN